MRPVCGVCGSPDLEMVLSLGSSPPTCAMQRIGERGPETHYPLDLLHCRDCTLVQLSVIPDRDEVFPRDYPYSSGNNAQLRANFRDLAAEIDPWPSRDSIYPANLIVDIGANDGTLLREFSGARTVGVEPTDQARKITGFKYQQPFTEALARRIVAEHGPADVVTACNVLAHIDDLDEVMRGIRYLLRDKGLLVAENGDLGALVERGAWDFVYHEHLRYYSPYSFYRLLERYRFGWRSCRQTETHGGSFRVFARKAARDIDPPEPQEYDFARLQRAAERMRGQLRALVTEEGPVWGIGATARATTVINYCGLDVEDVCCICELPGSDKIGRHIPGTRIPVVSEDRMLLEQPPLAVLFSWHLADSIVPKLRERGYCGQIVVPQLEATHADLAAQA